MLYHPLVIYVQNPTNKIPKVNQEAIMDSKKDIYKELNN